MNKYLNCVLLHLVSAAVIAQQPNMTNAPGADLGKFANTAAMATSKPTTITIADGGGTAATVISLHSGQVLRFGAGTYVIAGIDLPDSTNTNQISATVECAGIDKTVLKLADGANRSVITDTHFGSLTGKSNYFGAFRAAVKDCTIDGNKSHNQRGSGIRLYGRGLQIENVHVQDAAEDGVYTEWNGDSTFANPEDDLEANITNLKTMFNGGNGMTSKGPHDLWVRGFISYQNRFWGWDIQTPLHASQVNAFLNKSGGCWTHGVGSISGADVICMTASGIGLLVDNSGGPAVLASGMFAGPVALELRQAHNQIQGVVSASTVAGVRLAGGGGMLSLVMYDNTGVWFDCQSVLPGNVISVSSLSPKGALFAPNCGTNGSRLGKMTLAVGGRKDAPVDY
ncbi:MAG TPA: hypothetical protein VFR08_03520 [Candidatus Angelobacter sp.]|nr:hypothetical protein [Candidatus Angelobacter sp.]